MITLNGREYRLCLIDTNVISEMLKHPEREFANFVTKYLTNACIPSFAFFTVLELRESRALLDAFLHYFSILPCVLLKSHEQLLENEAERYDDKKSVDPILHTATLVQPPSLRDVITQTFATRRAQRLAAQWLDGRSDALSGMLALRENYPPANGKRYSKKEISEFTFMAGTEQLGLRQRDFCKRHLKKGAAIDLERFPSLKAQLYTVFFKLYADKRKEQRSDVFDIIISATMPYVDVFLTERHQVEVVRRTKQHDSFLDHLETQSIDVLR